MWRTVVQIDPTKTDEFQQSTAWDRLEKVLSVFQQKPDGSYQAFSFSGGERNRMFMRNSDGNYYEATLPSGVDYRSDGRGFVLLDYDQDNFVDMGIISTTSPRFRLARNRISDIRKEKSNAVFVSLAGGNQTSEPSTEWSSRDGIGAELIVRSGDKTRMFQANCGEGLSSQNSKWIHIGLGDVEKIDEIKVRWPSGKTTIKKDIPAGQRVTLPER